MTQIGVNIVDKKIDKYYVEKTHDQVTSLLEFDINRELLQRQIRSCISRCQNKKHALFPSILFKLSQYEDTTRLG